ncbi:hypothetical protein [Nocardioides marmoraquaticus]
MAGALLALLLLRLVALSPRATVVASLRPDAAYAETGTSRGATAALLIMGCVIGVTLHALVLRPRLVRAGRR